MGNIIAFSGSHGTGKTTAVYKKHNSLKMNNTDKEVGMILEVAKRCPFEINEKAPKEAQLWIFCEQITTELLISSVYGLVVSDRSVIDVIAYTMALGYKSLGNAMLGIAKDHMHIYKEIHFKSIEKNDYLKDDGVRSMDKDFRKRVEDWMLDLYCSMRSNSSKIVYYE